MILVDTSVWIELLKAGPTRRVPEEDLANFVTCGPIVQELLQGLREGSASEGLRESLLAMPILDDPLPLSAFVSAAGIYRLGRAKGYTIRSSVDCLIAAIAIEHGVPVWHRDRDYERIARYTSLLTRSWREQPLQ